jgi:hypothetical protein
VVKKLKKSVIAPRLFPLPSWKKKSTIWLAPSLHYVPVKMRVTGSYRGMLEATLEATLDSIRVDETLARQ